LIPDNTQAFLRISELLYSMGDADDSLINIRECLKLDADHKECHIHYIKVKKLAKQLESIRDAISQSQWNDCLDKANQILKLSSDPLSHAFIYRAHSSICTCMSRGKSATKETIATCTSVLDTYHVSDAEVLVSRAEAYILNEEFELALADFQRAKETEDSNRINDGIKRVQKLIKQLKKRDYYKILGMRRTANKAEILRAYRKLAVKWHPDKYEGEDKKKAEKMFIDIAAAKEVLTDPGLYSVSF
jgi:DnaJ family protein C protein 3